MPPVIPDKIPCDTLQQFLAEVSSYKDILELTENEETWDRIERALARFSAVIKGGGHQFKRELVDAFKNSHRPVVSALNSERTRLSTTALDCIGIAAPRLGLDFEPLVPIYVPAILRLSNRTNKVYVKRAHTTMDLIIGFCHIPSILHHLITACKESKISTGRIAAIDGALRALNKWDWTQKDIRNKVTDIEEMIRITGRDKDAIIRQTSRQVFEAYKNIFPERVSTFTAPLTPVMRRYLEITPEERGRPIAKTESSNSVTTASTGESNLLGLSVRSTSTQRADGGHSLSFKPQTQNPRPPITSARTMPPPITVPNKDVTGSKTVSRSPLEDQDNQERQRLLSSISSTFSVKSVPTSSKPFIEHQPPIRLGSSQSRSASVSAKPTLTSSGPARRVRRVVSTEQTNRPDLFAMARKAATRTVPQVKNQLGLISTIDQGGVSFPKSDLSLPGMERRGAQRVPKPIPLPPPASTLPVDKPGNVDEASTATSEAPAIPIQKKETKPSLFRRGGNADEKQASTTKEGFVPRRGGLLQPTLSQLNKQKPTVSNPQSRSRVVSNAGTMKRSDVKKVTSTNRPTGSTSQLVKSNSGESGQGQDMGGNQTQTTGPSSTASVSEEKPEITDQKSDSKEANDSTGTEVPELESSVPNEVLTENDTFAVQVKEIQSELATNLVEDEIRSRESTPAPQTPSSSNVDNKEVSKEMPENIEFIPEVMHDTAGISVKTNVANTASENSKSPDRTPLVEVFVNE
ncbi:hypothetical protein Clacol_000779 [Clathrus columnatus]|uniref:CLASP N-terminal domain-containing protein n=1 Tax=Clathrus columnatus TaxID=1419009 RepID=A0AAV4ZX44_9AGAM|nr:hypothetical protein Clacol_000779 [Clathrus columnatus]